MEEQDLWHIRQGPRSPQGCGSSRPAPSPCNPGLPWLFAYCPGGCGDSITIQSMPGSYLGGSQKPSAGLHPAEWERNNAQAR